MFKIINFSTSITTFLLPLIVSANCMTEDASLPEIGVHDYGLQIPELMKDTISLVIGENHFIAILESNPTSREFKKMLPITISMKDLNNNEKFFDLPGNLPANTSQPLTINSGDLMLWGSNTLVLFYKTFKTSYPYTRLGKVENPSELSRALGPGNATVTFELHSK